MVGLSPSASVQWSCVEQRGGVHCQRWLTADPIDRLLVDPASIVAPFDVEKY